LILLHTQTSSNSSTIAAGSSNGVTNTRFDITGLFLTAAEIFR